jgi:hypothetical protein
LGEECIHGLDYGVCDACFPKARPVEPEVAVKTRVPRVASGMPKRTGALKALDDVSQQRVYHVTHISNLASILEAGIVADATPTVDISSIDVRSTRRTITVSDEGETVAAYVPFFLTPTSDVWDAIRFGAVDPRLSVASDAVPSDFVMLVSSISTIDKEHTVVADGDAAHPLTRFAVAPDAGERTLRKLRAEDESGRIRSAEVLVKDSVPFEHITLITVANDRAKAAVRAILDPAGYRTRIAIHPPWFTRSE